MKFDLEIVDPDGGLKPLDCIGCGWCCLHDPCEVSHDLYGYLPRCPELAWKEDAKRYVCLLVLDEHREQEARRRLFVGEGCCARDNEWRNNIRNRDDDPRWKEKKEQMTEMMEKHRK
ncbi:MAG: hypothetical protein ACNI27_03915 [Desulfovibrio sp.]